MKAAIQDGSETMTNNYKDLFCVKLSHSAVTKARRSCTVGLFCPVSMHEIQEFADVPTRQNVLLQQSSVPAEVQ